MQKKLKTSIEQARIPGISVVNASRDSQPVTEQAGVITNKEEGAKIEVTKDTIFEAASLSKPETQFNDRAVSILILKNPLLLEDGFTVSMIELPAPRPVHMYPSGLESNGVVVGKELPEFIKQHESVLTGVKEHGQYCQPAFIAFDNDKTAKFYDISLRDIVVLQGWKIELLEINSITM
ncbi:MAG: hypothetical protein H0T84_00695 [Tatlockia sp.]|nr:hypothetical protein [Tatlockia sp.]